MIKEDILEYMKDPPFPVTVNEISKKFSLEEKETKQILNKLTLEGLVEMQKKNKIYVIKD